MDLPDNFYEPITVYVPANPPRGDVAGIVTGSGIVGSGYTSLAGVLIDFEGARRENVRTFADRVMIAHGRHVMRYPTVARRAVSEASVTAVGLYFPRDRQVQPDELEAIADWIGVPFNDADQLARELRSSDPRSH